MSENLVSGFRSLRLEQLIESVTTSSEKSRHRLIVGIDYGTTFSGISFVTTDRASADEITVIRTWPGKDGEWKTPTRIAYASENTQYGLKKNSWGFEVDPRMVSCSWTKLLLDTSAETAVHDDPKLKNAIDEGMLHRPPGKTAQDVCTDFLKEMYTYMMARLSKQVSESVLKATPMDCWLTVPAVWTDTASNATKAAAKAAGFGARPGDTINIISEPEAAAISALKKYMEPTSLNPPKAGETIVICDCGGGTVDITTYTIVETTPRLEFEEICIGTGGKCGSTFIDRNLQALMRWRFGKAFDQVEMKRKGPGSRFMNSWESIKRSFGSPGADSGIKELGPLRMEGVGSSDYYDEEEGMVQLTREDIEGLFAPVVNEIIKLLANQKKEVEAQQRNIDRVILIGGFGDSDYLCDRLKTWCHNQGGIQVLCPEHPQAAIVRGAALRGLEGTAPRKKRCRRHYGTSSWQIFREGIDPDSKARYCDWDNSKRCDGRMNWLIGKGDQITPDTKRTISLFIPATRGSDLKSTCYLYSCSLDEPPEYDDHPRVERIGQIHTDFTNVDRSKVPKKREFRWIGKKIYCLEFDVEVRFGGQAGVLEFKTLVGGAVSGRVSITFD